MMVSGGEVKTSVRKVTSARCTHVEVEGRLNCRVITCREELIVRGSCTLARESQEVVVTEIVVRIFLVSEVALRVRLSTDIPHSGQLNITTSTPLTPV